MAESTSESPSLLWGVGLLVAIGLTARPLADLSGLNHLIVAIALGAVVVNVAGLPDRVEPGVGTYKVWLETGIVVMGARLALDHLVDRGPTLLLLVVGVLTFTLLFVETVARRVFDLEEKMGSLVAAGSSICGVSAVIAVAGSIKADDEQIAYAVATILLFDAATIFLYPAVGNLLHLPARTFGIWAGVSMFSTGPVTAAGFAYSDTAGQWAVLTKLTRNALIGVLAVAYSVRYATGRAADGTRTVGQNARQVWESFPKFVVGMLLVMLIANLGGMADAQVASLKNAYRWLFLVAFAGLGCNIRLRDMRAAGLRPIGTVLVTFLVVSAGTLTLLTVVLGG